MNNDGPQLVDTGRGYSVTYKGRHLYSRNNPRRSILRVIEKTDILPDTLVFVPSPLLFYGVQKLLSENKKAYHLLCVESDEVLMAFSVQHCPKPILEEERITFVRTSSSRRLAEVVDQLGAWRFRRAIMLQISGGYSLNRDTYDELFKELDLFLQQSWQNRMTLIHMGKLWMRNILQNLRFLPGSSDFDNLAVCRPILAVGAGESLEQSLHMIKSHRDKLFILCADTALPVLISESIFPDLVLAVEAQFSNYLDFMQARELNVPVLCDLSSNPAVMRMLKGDKYFFLSQFADCDIFRRMNSNSILPHLIPPLGSVGVIAVYFALKLTSGAVFFTGLDFSFVKGKPHSRGAPSHSLSMAQSNRTSSIGWYESSVARPLIKIPGKAEESRTTDIVFYNYCRTLSSLIQHENRVFDLGRRGLFTGAPVVEDEAAFKEILVRYRYDGPIGKERTGTINKTAIVAFIRREIALLEKLKLDSAEFMQNPGNAGMQKQLVLLLKDLDYMYLHFPDKSTTKPEKGFVLRCMASADEYCQILRRVAHMLGDL